MNNVGDYRPLVRFAKSTPESWEAMYQINLRHIFAVTRAFLDPMIDSGGGSIVNFHSVEGMRGYPGEPVYGAMKGAVAHFTTCLAASRAATVSASTASAPTSPRRRRSTTGR